MADKTITITDVPDLAEWRERVLTMAREAKAAAWQSGSPAVADHVLIRAALVVDDMIRHEVAWEQHGGHPVDMVVYMAAVTITPELDAERGDVRSAILKESLPNPWDALSEMVNSNRRLFGLPPQETSDDVSDEPDCVCYEAEFGHAPGCYFHKG